VATRILIVDDHPLTREALSSLLRAHGFDVAGEAADGATAVVEAARLRPDLVLLDLSMPGMDGLTALPQLRAAAPECEVVVLTASGTEANLLAAIRAGAADVEVAHVFLEAPEDPVVARFQAAEAETLERELNELTRGVVERRFEVTEIPQRSICTGCPAEGGLCSWPLEMTRRESVEQLF